VKIVYIECFLSSVIFPYSETYCSLAEKFYCHVFEAQSEEQVTYNIFTLLEYAY